MSWLSIFTLAVGLATDAMAVSAARGLLVPRITLRHVALVMLFFGGAQALMPLVGWAVGARLGAVVSAWDHWIAFVLLGAIGGKMLWEARAGEEDAAPPAGDPFALPLLFTLAIATSIDALAVGVTLPLLGAPLVATVTAVGAITAALSALGLFAGRKFGAVLGKRLDAVGGLVLIGLGTKILVEHLSA